MAIIRVAMPPVSISRPARTKSGMVSSGKGVRLEYPVCAISV